jgi:hypothetical protein
VSVYKLLLNRIDGDFASAMRKESEANVSSI